MLLPPPIGEGEILRHPVLAGDAVVLPSPILENVSIARSPRGSADESQAAWERKEKSKEEK
jgi:hypothetical protein